jgi:hypothetical protein
MIADVVKFAIEGLDFCRMAGPSILRGKVSPNNSVVLQRWTRWWNRGRVLNVSAPTKDV